MKTKTEIISIFEKTGALLTGHFQLSSGLHSNQYFQCAKVLQYPDHAAALGEDLADLFRGERIDCVIGPALGGIIIAWEVARALGARGFFAERVNGAMQLRRGFSVGAGERVLVVEDVITTGGSAGEVVACLRDQCSVAAVASIVDRSSAPPSFGVPYKSLLKMEAKTFDPKACPLCEAGKPVDKPGSRPQH
jgi:orotate phosphoribosyltransferase